MTDYLHGPLAALTLGFDTAGLLRAGRRFRHQCPATRRAQLARWRDSRVGAQRDFARLYDSLATLAYYSRSQPDVTASPAAEFADGVLGQPDRLIDCEVVVIGSGPGGSITACLLAEAGRDVLLLEEGPCLTQESCAPFSRQEMEQKYRNGGLTVALGRTKIAYVEGRCVGGGSEINSGLYHRTPPEILAQWQREFAVAGLSASDMEPHFAACERDLSVSLMPGSPPPASARLHAGASALGWKSFEVPRWYRYDPAHPQGVRQSMTRTFVPRFVAAGGRILPDTRANRLRRDGTRWELFAQHRSDGAVRIRAQTVFVCGGAVQTPALLQRSGVGTHVGRSLRLHPTVKLVARFPEPVNSDTMGVPVHQVKEFAPRLSFGCSISTPPYLALALLDHPGLPRDVAQSWPHLATYYAMTCGEGHGTVRALPGFRDPLVRYRLTPHDQATLGEGLQKLARALFAAGAEAVMPSLPGSPVLRSAEELARRPVSLPPGASGLMTIHLFSSCPMGENTAKCATDSFGRVHGVPGLIVSDASLLCGSPGVNPQGTIMALARRNALHFLGQL
ncbi:MAG: GMC family oxidoreductase [Opitutus sp.]|nr:GMC family oxidoreductase [Opitutus sp.]